MNTEAAQLLSPKSDKKGNRNIIVICVALIIVAGLCFGIGYFVGTLETKDSSSEHFNIVDTLDIAIIGGGASGIYQAYNLRENNPELSLKIFEKLSRIGGRQFSSHLHVVDEDENILRSIHFENVAMRFRQNQNLTLQLLSYLDLCDDIAPFAQINNPIEISNYFRNSFLNNRNNRTYTDIYNVSPEERLYVNGSISFWDKIFDEIIEENGNIIPQTLNEWEAFRVNYTYKGKKLNKWSKRAVLSVNNASTELVSYFYRVDTMSNNPLYSESFVNTFSSKYEYEVNRSSHSMWTLQDGYNSMVKKLYQLLISGVDDESHETVLLNHKVTAIDKYNDNQYLIEINDGEYYYKSNKVILSVPPVAMKKLIEKSPVLNVTTMNNLVNSLYGVFNAKVNLIFDDTFWINNSIQSFGPAPNDLVLGEFIIDNSQTNHTLTCLHVFVYFKHLPLIYNLQQIGDDYPMHTSIKMENDDAFHGTGLEIASGLVVEKLMSDLSILTSMDNIPFPKAAFIAFQGDDNFDISGLYWYKTGQNIEEFLEKQYNPINGEDIFIAISDFNPSGGGFMEDVLINGNENLQRNFDIENPLQNEEYCPFPF